MNGEVERLGEASEEAADSLAPLEAPELVRLPDPVLGDT